MSRGSPTPTPVPASKICAVCGVDLSGKRRTKDTRGRYYCNRCWEKLVERHRQHQTARVEADSAPAPDAAPFDDLPDFTPPAAASPPPLPPYPSEATREWTVPPWVLRLWDTSGLSARERYKVLGFRYRVGGIFLQLLPGFIIALIANTSAESWLNSDEAMNGFAVVCGLIVITGAGVFMAGLGYYAMFKGRSPHWCVAGLFGIPGLLVLMLLQDHWVETRKPAPFGY